jgi:hypothetical protein
VIRVDRRLYLHIINLAADNVLCRVDAERIRFIAQQARVLLLTGGAAHDVETLFSLSRLILLSTLRPESQREVFAEVAPPGTCPELIESVIEHFDATVAPLRDAYPFAVELARSLRWAAN